MKETLQQKEIRELEREIAQEFGWTQWRGPYSALPTPTSIRLLKFVGGQTDSPIQCSFEIFDLNDLPVYNALSYTWGNPRGLLPPGEDVEADRIAMSAIYPILCEGQIIEITANCYSFIRSFQKHQESAANGTDTGVWIDFTTKAMSYIWIDAICINQDSMTERSSQVRIMDRVYRQAVKVLIWLGPEDALTREGLQAIILLARMRIETRDIPSERIPAVVGQMLDCPLFKKHKLPDIQPTQWQGLLCLFRRTWFTRVWT